MSSSQDSEDVFRLHSALSLCEVVTHSCSKQGTVQLCTMYNSLSLIVEVDFNLTLHSYF